MSTRTEDLGPYTVIAMADHRRGGFYPKFRVERNDTVDVPPLVVFDDEFVNCQPYRTETGAIERALQHARIRIQQLDDPLRS